MASLRDELSPEGNEAEQMTALLSGYVFAGLQNLKGVLKEPIEWQECNPNGMIRFKLASGMDVKIAIYVDPVTETNVHPRDSVNDL